MNQSKNVMIGIFVLSAIILFTWSLLFLHPTLGDGQRVLRVRFTNIDKVTVGTRVTYGGKPVGEVTKVRLIEDARHKEKTINGQLYTFELKLRVDSTVNVYDTDKITITTSGLLGDRNVDIAPRPAVKGREPQIINDQIIYSTPSGSVEGAIQELSDIATKVDSVVDYVLRSLDEKDGIVHAILVQLRDSLANVRQSTASINDTQLIYTLKETLQNIRDVVGNINNQVIKLDKARFAEHVGAVSKNIDSITAALNQPDALEQTILNIHQVTGDLSRSWPTVERAISDIGNAAGKVDGVVGGLQAATDQIRAGKGTIGRLLMRDDFYLDTTAILSKANTVMNDINHYGLLFNRDKGWQRLRRKRYGELSRLSSVSGFRSYFDTELADINTSLSRVLVLLEEVGDAHDDDKLALNENFSKAFSALLRRVSTLQDTLNLYNEKLFDDRSSDGDPTSATVDAAEVKGSPFQDESLSLSIDLKKLYERRILEELATPKEEIEDGEIALYGDQEREFSDSDAGHR